MNIPNNIHIFISGPMTGLPSLNHPAFLQAERELLEMYPTCKVINPATLFTAHEIATHAYDYFMRRDLEELLKCDAIVMLPGYWKSSGARTEYYVAKSCNLFIGKLTYNPWKIKWSKA